MNPIQVIPFNIFPATMRILKQVKVTETSQCEIGLDTNTSHESNSTHLSYHTKRTLKATEINSVHYLFFPCIRSVFQNCNTTKTCYLKQETKLVQCRRLTLLGSED